MASLKQKRLLLGGPAFTPQAKALFAAMTTPPTLPRKILINNLIVSLQLSGVWQRLDTLYLLAAANSQAALLNWKNPVAFAALEVNAPTFVVDRGYTGNGSSSRLRTQYTPSVNGVQYTLNDASAWVWSRTNAQATVSDIGSITVPRVFLQSRTTGDVILADINNAGSAQASSANTNSAGFFGVQRRGSTDRRLFANGVQIGADAQVSTAVASQEQWICGANSAQFSSKQIAGAAWAASLAGLEASFYTAVAAYMTGVGAA